MQNAPKVLARNDAKKKKKDQIWLAGPPFCKNKVLIKYLIWFDLPVNDGQ